MLCTFEADGNELAKNQHEKSDGVKTNQGLPQPFIVSANCRKQLIQQIDSPQILKLSISSAFTITSYYYSSKLVDNSPRAFAASRSQNECMQEQESQLMS